MPNQKRDNSIDFIKGVAILSVIFLHNTLANKLFQIAWIGQAVPLFLLVTAYLTYGSFENGKTVTTYYSYQSTGKMIKRIFIPFLIVTLFQCVIYYLFSSHFSWYSVIRSGGIGPGSYYPWLYLQCWIILPFIIYVTDKISIYKSILLFIGISVVLELMSSVLSISPSIYRLLIFRYLFLIYLGCTVRKLNAKMNFKWIILAVVGLLFAGYEIYLNADLRPWFYNQWKGYHWITASYAVFIFIFIRKIYNTIQYALSFLGKNSWEIFLCQMFVFSFFSKRFLSFIGNPYIETITFILLTTILSISPILIYKICLKNLINISPVSGNGGR